MSELPTNQEIVDRLMFLSDFIVRTPNLPSEFSLRVPAEPKRDADLVLALAADRITELEAENKRLKLQLEGRTYCHSDEQVEAENKRLTAVVKRCNEKAYRGRSTHGHNCDSTNACRSIEEITEQALQGEG